MGADKVSIKSSAYSTGGVPRGSVPVILSKHVVTCDFSRWGRVRVLMPSPLEPPMHHSVLIFKINMF